MKSRYLLIIIISVSAALGLGWFFDNRTMQIVTPPLEIPDNIDYYLSDINFKSMNQQGSVHYILTSPYLEHYIRQDTSHIEQPYIQLNEEESSWLMHAETGKLQHKKEQFELYQQVELENTSALNPILLNTSYLILKARSNIVEIPQDMTVTSKIVNLTAASARLNIKSSLYQFERVKATYQVISTHRKPHEQS